MRNLKLSGNEYYHIYNRGAGKQKIFHDAEDYTRFLKILYIFNNQIRLKFKDLIKSKKDIFDINIEEKLLDISLFVLMPNHFHLVLTSPFLEGGENISLFMQKVCSSYSQYYNKKYKRTGTLFEGFFKVKYVGTDEYFKYLFSYIHLNPIKLIQSDWKEVGIKSLPEAKTYLNKYPYSSYGVYFPSPFLEGGRKGLNKIVNKDSFLKMLPKKISLEKELFEWLNFKNSEIL